MSTRIIDAPSAQGPVLTSAIYSLRATTDKDKIPVSIVRDPDGTCETVFATVLYSSAGSVELEDIGSLIEENFRDRGLVTDIVEVRFDSASARFTAIYCEYDMPPGFNPELCFLASADESVIHTESIVSLALPGQDSTVSFRMLVVGPDEDGMPRVSEREFSASRVNGHLMFPAKAITSNAAAWGLTKVSYFILSVDGRRKTFYVATDPYYLTFGFRNMFNALEYVDVVGTVTRLTAYERAMAMCSGKAQQYDRTVARTYEVQTGPLTDGQVRELEQLIGSRSVRLCAGSADYEVIVTDHTLEISNDDSTLPTVKFTFRFAGDRPRLLSSELGSLMLSGSRIFSKEFSPEFS